MLMPRGRLLRTKKKEAKVLMRASHEGFLEAEAKAFTNKKILKAKILNWLTQHKVMDIVKFGSVLGMTWIIKNIIVENFEDIVVKQITGKGLYPFLGFFYPILAKSLGLEALEPVLKEALDRPEIEVVEWILSFALAYIMVEHGAEIIKATGSLVSSVGMLLGAAAAA